jgi:hypothetical protein
MTLLCCTARMGGFQLETKGFGENRHSHGRPEARFLDRWVVVVSTAPECRGPSVWGRRRIKETLFLRTRHARLRLSGRVTRRPKLSTVNKPQKRRHLHS